MAVYEDMTEETSKKDAEEEKDIFFRPSEFRQSTVLAIWEKGKRVKGKPNHRHDWRNGNVVGPWEPGQLRDGVWDVGHIEPWYRVVERLKKVKGVTREMVLDEFNDLENLGVEDPETNRKLGVNSRVMGVERLPYEKEEETLFESKQEEERQALRQRFRQAIDEKSEHVNTRIGHYARKGTDMTEEKKDAVKQPKRVIVWDTETTGLSTKNGDKIVEIGAIEMVDGKPTGKQYHQYINPERSIPSRATAVHGITDEMVKDKPIFKDIAEDFLKFVGDAPLVAHNASFDMRFINAELEAVKRDAIPDEKSIDTLKLARRVLPELDSHTLDVLAEHFDVDTSGREDVHGGLVDSVILSEVYQGLATLAEKQGVDIQNLGAKSAKSRMAGDVGEQEFDKAARFEQAAQEARLAKKGKAPHAEENTRGGFAERLRDELQRQENTRGGIGL